MPVVNPECTCLCDSFVFCCQFVLLGCLGVPCGTCTLVSHRRFCCLPHRPGRSSGPPAPQHGAVPALPISVLVLILLEEHGRVRCSVSWTNRQRRSTAGFPAPPVGIPGEALSTARRPGETLHKDRRCVAFRQRAYILDHPHSHASAHDMGTALAGTPLRAAIAGLVLAGTARAVRDDNPYCAMDQWVSGVRWRPPAEPPIRLARGR